jgi:hypothetical protein
MSTDDDKFINSMLDEEEGRKRRTTRTDKEMSDHPKDSVKGVSAVSKEGSEEIDEVKALKRQWGKLRQRTPGLQKYKFDEVHIRGDKIEIDEEKYKERLKHEEDLMKKNTEITAESRVEGHVIKNPLPKFDPKIGFKAYNKEKWDNEKELELI